MKSYISLSVKDGGGGRGGGSLKSLHIIENTLERFQ